MSTQLKSLFSATTVYALANLLQRGMSLILLPIYARYFSKAEFGAMDLLYQSVMILIIFTSLGMPQGIPRGIHHGENTEDDNKKMLGVLSFFLILMSIFVFLLVNIFSTDLNGFLFKADGKDIWLQMTTWFFVAMAIQQYPLNILKAYQRSIEYSIWSIATFIIAAAGNVYLIVFKEMGLTGMLIANSIAFGVVGVIAFVRCLSFMQVSFDLSRLKPLLAFGLPMLPALLGRKVLEVSDRFMLPQYHPVELLGEYVMGAKIANIVEVMVLVPFLFAWQPFFYSIAKKDHAPLIFAKVSHYFISVTIMVFMAMLIFHEYILLFLGSGAYTTSSLTIMLLVTSVLINGIQYTISPGIHIKSKLVQEMCLMLIAAVLNFILNLILIPKFAAEGAALSTLISYFFYFISTLYLSQVNYPVVYPLSRMLKISLLGLVAILLIYFIDSILLKLVIATAFVLIGPVLDFYRYDKSMADTLLK